MAETQSDASLQALYLQEVRAARDDKRANADYTADGVRHLRQAGKIQLELARASADPGVGARHVELARELLRQAFDAARRNDLISASAVPAPPVPDSVQPSFPTGAPAASDLGDGPAGPSGANPYEPPLSDGAAAPRGLGGAAAPVQPDRRDGEDGKPADDNGELEGFDIEQFVVKPGKVRIEDAEAAYPEIVSDLKRAVDKNKSFARMYPGLADLGDLAVVHHFFYGPPGTGKTFICQGLASYLDSKFPGGRSRFFTLESSKIMSKWVGTAEHRIRKVFEAAATYECAVVCIDEVEKLCPDRGGDSKTNYTNTLLELIDGVCGKTNAIVIFASNYPQKVDQALVSRGGNLHFIDYPGVEALKLFLNGRGPTFLSGLGATQDEQQRVVERLASYAASRHFSYRSMNVLVDALKKQMMDKMVELFPNGSDAEQCVPLSGDEIDDACAGVSSDFDQAAYQTLVNYHREHGGGSAK